MPSVKIIPAGKLVNIQCKLNLGDTTSKVPMLFEIEEIELPERLETSEEHIGTTTSEQQQQVPPELDIKEHQMKV